MNPNHIFDGLAHFWWLTTISFSKELSSHNGAIHHMAAIRLCCGRNWMALSIFGQQNEKSQKFRKHKSKVATRRIWTTHKKIRAYNTQIDKVHTCRWQKIIEHDIDLRDLDANSKNQNILITAPINGSHFKREIQKVFILSNIQERISCAFGKRTNKKCRYPQ